MLAVTLTFALLSAILAWLLPHARGITSQMMLIYLGMAVICCLLILLRRKDPKA